MKRHELSSRTVEARAVALRCPVCKALPDEGCMTVWAEPETGRRFRTTTHVPRLRLAKQQLAAEKAGESCQ